MRLDAGGDEAEDLLLQPLAVDVALLVPDHQVDRQALQAPPGVGLHHLPDEVDARRFTDPQQHDRQVARDGVAPQPRLAAPVAQQRRGIGAQRRLRVDHRAGQSRVELRVGLAGVDLAQDDLAVRPGEVEHAVGQPPVDVLVRQRQAGLARVGHAVDDVDDRGLRGLQRDHAPRRSHRVEHRPRAARQGAGLAQRLRRVQAAAAADEARAVGLMRHPAGLGAVHRQQVQHVGRGLVGGTRPAGAQQRRRVGQALRLHEQLAEGRVLRVGGCRRDHHLGVAGDLDAAPPAAAVGDAQPPQLDVVFGRDDDFGVGIDALVAAPELGPPFGEDGLVGVGLPLRRLVRRRPEGAGLGVAQVAEAAPLVAGRVLAPARDGQILPAADAAAGIRQHHVITAVGQQLHLGCRGVGGLDQVQRRLGGADAGAHLGTVGGVGVEGHRLRYALLQQQQRGLERRVGLEAALHRLVEQQIGQRQQAHALVVRHVRAHDRAGLAARQARRRVVDRLVVTEGAGQALVGQALQVLDGGSRFDHQRHHAGVRRHHQVLGQAALEAQTRHAEGAVLVVQVGVGGVVARLGHAPRHTALAPIADLAVDGREHGLVQQRVVVARHHQHRHQVLEHRAAPRQQQGVAVHRGEQASEGEPVGLRHLALRDGGEAGQAHFGGQQVVVAGIAAVLVDVVADGHQVACRVVEEAVFHVRQVAAALGQPQQGVAARAQRRRAPRRRTVRRRVGRDGAGQQRPQFGDGGLALVPQGAGPAACIGLRRCIGVVGQARRCARGRRGHRLVDHVRRAAGQGVEGTGQRGRRLRRPRQGLVQQRHEAGQCRTPRRGAVRRLQQARRIAQAAEQPRRLRQLVGQQAQAGAQCQQVAGQVAAVDRGDVGRQQGLQGLRVVPVEEVALVALQPVHGVQRRPRTLDQLVQRDVAEVVGRQAGQQRQSDVGGRGAAGNAFDRMFLHVVGRQEVVGRADEGLEKGPGAAAQQAQELRLLGVQRRQGPLQRPADPPDDQRRRQPQGQHRRGERQRQRTIDGQRGEGGQRQRRPDPHALQRAQQPRPAGGGGGGAAGDLGRRLPLEQAAPREPQAGDGARHGVEAVGGLVGQAGQAQRGLAELAPGGRHDRRQVFAQPQRVGLAQQIQQQGRQRRQEQHADARQRPHPRRLEHAPAEQEKRAQRRRRQAAPQVVGNLQPRQRRQRILQPDHALARRAVACDFDHRNAQPGHQPADDLPVAADPAVAAGDVGVVARGRLLHHLHVADQAAARVAAFQQVVAEDAVLRQAIAQHVFEGVDVVDPLADERAFAEQVLVDVGHGAGVGVDAEITAEQACVARAVGAGQAQSDARLQDAVAADHPRRLGRAAQARAVQRVRHGGHELAGHVARQQRVGVQRDDVAHLAQRGGVADDQREAFAGAGAGAPAQQCIQVGELAAFALATHPDALGRVPQARAVEQEEAVAVARGVVLAVQRLDPRCRQAQQRLVFGGRGARRIVEVGQQAEVQVGVAVGQETHFQLLCQVLDPLLAAQQRRHDDQGAFVWRDAELVVHARQQARLDQQTGGPVGQRHRQLAGRQQQRGADRQQPPAGRDGGDGPRQPA